MVATSASAFTMFVYGLYRCWLFALFVFTTEMRRTRRFAVQQLAPSTLKTSPNFVLLYVIISAAHANFPGIISPRRYEAHEVRNFFKKIFFSCLRDLRALRGENSFAIWLRLCRAGPSVVKKFAFYNPVNPKILPYSRARRSTITAWSCVI